MSHFNPEAKKDEPMPTLASGNVDGVHTAQPIPPEAVIFGQTAAMRDVRQKLE